MLTSYNWLKDYLGDSLPSSDKVSDLLTFHAFEIEGVEEREGETIIDVDVLPNRSSDSLSHRGIARELASLLDTKLAHDPLADKPTFNVTDKIVVKISDSAACPRFTLSLITGVVVKESPEWLQKRLKALGQRPINNIVDATNYVMYAVGQPMHAYDADRFPQVDGKWQFGVRFATEGESVSLLAEGGKDEDRVVELKGTELLIIDGSSDTPVGLAGIKGGRFAELDKDTKNIIVEAAHFNPAVIRKTARRLGILTDASKRFENEPARELPPYAQQEIINLITKIAGGECEGMVDEYLEKYKPVTTKVRVEKLNSLLGLSLGIEEVKKIIEQIGASVTEAGEGELSVIAPWERTDLNIEVDYIEEVGRIHGLAGIQSVVPEPTPISEINSRQYYGDKVRAALMEAGFSEVITSSFRKKDKIQLQNALASDKSYLRSSLIKNITEVLDANHVHTDLLGIPDVRVFEIGTVFSKTDSSVTEHVSLSLGARTKGNGYNQKDDVVLKAGCEAVEKVFGTEVYWQIAKGVAECNFTEALDTLPGPDSYDPLPERPAATYKPISPYPAIARDIALWVPSGETADSVAAVLKEAAGSLLVRFTLFDTFAKDGRTSYAFRLVFQSKEKTLTDSEINEQMEKIYKVSKGKDWEVR